MDEVKLARESEAQLESRIEDIAKAFRASQEGEEAEDALAEAEGIRFGEYGLCFDYVSRDTFHDQKEGYWRYQLSWGGPSEEFRFFTDAERNIVRIEWWYLNWFCGHKIELEGEKEELMTEIFEDFKDMDMVESAFDKAFSG